jgi:hypothetical protein
VVDGVGGWVSADVTDIGGREDLRVAFLPTSAVHPCVVLAHAGAFSQSKSRLSIRW